MAEAKRKYIRVNVLGTGMNQTFIALSHEIVGFQASTYHKFVMPNGNIAYQNDFGVSCVTVTPVEMTATEVARL